MATSPPRHPSLQYRAKTGVCYLEVKETTSLERVPTPKCAGIVPGTSEGLGPGWRSRDLLY